MKKVTIIMCMLLSLGMHSACSSDDEISGIGSGGTLIPKERFNSVSENDYTGRLYYAEYLKAWVISFYHSGSIDCVDVYYPLNLPDEFKANKGEGINVSFSGKVIEMTDEDIKSLNIPLLGGEKYFFVYLTIIKKIE